MPHIQFVRRHNGPKDRGKAGQASCGLTALRSSFDLLTQGQEVLLKPEDLGVAPWVGFSFQLRLLRKGASKGGMQVLRAPRGVAQPVTA